MKKLLALFLVLAMLFSFAGYGKKVNIESDDPDTEAVKGKAEDETEKQE